MASKYTIPQLQELLAAALKNHGSTSKEYRRYKGALNYLLNPARQREASRRYLSDPKVKANAYAKVKHRYHTDPAFRARMNATSNKWRLANPEKMAAAQRKKNLDPIHRLKDKIHSKLRSALIRHALRQPGERRGRPSQDFYPELGCSIGAWKQHLEKQFTQDMTWDNHGSHWQIDHIIPKHKFDLPKEINQCFHYTNTRPLLRLDNLQMRKNV